MIIFGVRKEGTGVEKIDWSKAKSKYIKGSMSYAKLAAEMGISCPVLTKKATKEHWPDLRKEYREKTIKKGLEKSAAAAAARLARVGETAGILIDQTLEAMGDPAQLHRYLIQRQQEYAEPRCEKDGTLISRDSWTEEQTFTKLDTKALREMTAALKDLTGILRNIYGIPTQAEAEAQRIAAERLEMDKAKAATDAGSSDIVVELPPEMEEWSR